MKVFRVFSVLLLGVAIFLGAMKTPTQTVRLFFSFLQDGSSQIVFVNVPIQATIGAFKKVIEERFNLTQADYQMAFNALVYVPAANNELMPENMGVDARRSVLIIVINKNKNEVLG